MMTTGRVPLEVCSVLRMLESQANTDHSAAAFLTQTVALDDGTNVKFEIWYALFDARHSL